jgi:UDP-N-acetyl-D-mannosaminuronic acid dehydrogenase
MSDIVIIGGCGHVGLPLGLAFADAGKSVVALDRDAKKVAETNAGRMPFIDAGADELLTKVLKKDTFRCTTDPDVIHDADCVVTVIGTPLDEHLNPRLDVFRTLVGEYGKFLRKGQLLVLRSTVYPGTTNLVARSLKDQGIDIDVAFCPERVAQGVALEEIHSLPQIVSGTTPRAQERAEKLFRLLTKQTIALEPVGAELAKLYSNAWRYIQFAVANQFYQIANDHGVDFYAVHDAMTKDYPRTKTFPKAGFAAGPCLFKDTMQLAAYDHNAFFLGHAAMLVNEGFPSYLVRRSLDRWPLREMTVGILGMTFKGDCDDPRDSLSFKLKKGLEVECKSVICSDPFYSQPGFVSLDEAIAKADLLIIGTPHSAYKSCDYRGKPVVDIWRITREGISVL